jgi:pimeloyl-ACP methyl ester carboxylesterase
LIWHGFDSVNRLFHWKYIQKYGEVIRIGLPGHGPVKQKSWSHYRQWTEEHLIEVGVSVCKRYFSGTPLTLVGHSTGAHIALGAAMRLPQMISALVLVNPLLWSPVNGFVRFLAKSWLWRLVGTSALAPGIRRKRRSIGSFLEGIRPIIGDHDSFYGNPNTPSYTAAGHEDYKSSSIKALVNVARICATFDLRPALAAARLNVPALLIHGENDPISPVCQSEWAARHLLRATLVKLPGVGHISYGEREHQFAEIVTDWLDQRRKAPVHL